MNLITGDPLISEPGTNLHLTRTFKWDKRGNPKSERSPRGYGRADTDFTFLDEWTYDEGNLLRSSKTSAPFRYETTYFYDGNLKLTEERIPNVLPNDVNGNGIQDDASEQTTGSPAYFRTTYTYCVCNAVETRTVDASGLALKTTVDYDLNLRRNYVRSPEGNVTLTTWDERGLRVKEVRGAQDATNASTTRFKYDLNGNLERVHDDDLEVDPGDTAVVQTWDLFDRLTKTTDELLNELETIYDKASLMDRRIVRGNDGVNPGIRILAQTFYEYDEAGRLFQVDWDHFDAQTGMALADGTMTPPVGNTGAQGILNSTAIRVDREGRPSRVFGDNWEVSNTDTRTFAYDRADRLVQTVDGRGNTVNFVYDPDGNRIGVQAVEKADDGSPDQTFASRTFADEMGRPIVAQSPLGMSSGLNEYGEHFYGSGWPDVAVSGRGNTVRNTFDGAGRLTTTDVEMRVDGYGGGGLLDPIRLLRGYDRDSRLISQTDDNLNVTRYFYDANDRLSLVENADGTQKLALYDRAGSLRLVERRSPQELGLRQRHRRAHPANRANGNRHVAPRRSGKPSQPAVASGPSSADPRRRRGGPARPSEPRPKKLLNPAFAGR